MTHPFVFFWVLPSYCFKKGLLFFSLSIYQVFVFSTCKRLKLQVEKTLVEGRLEWGVPEVSASPAPMWSSGATLILGKPCSHAITQGKAPFFTLGNANNCFLKTFDSK